MPYTQPSAHHKRHPNSYTATRGTRVRQQVAPTYVFRLLARDASRILTAI